MNSIRLSRFSFLISLFALLAACAQPEPPVIVITAPPAAAGLTSVPISTDLVSAALPTCGPASAGLCVLAETVGSSATPYTPPPASPFASPTSASSPTFTPTLAPSETPTPAATETPAPTFTPTRNPDAPTITESTVTINTYNFQDHLVDTRPGDPIYPYQRIDYDPFDFDPGIASPRAYKILILENKYVSLTIVPELGGRIYRWLDKTTGRQLLYNNPVIKVTGYGYRGWWLAIGGIEWSLPVEDHGFVEWVPWNYATVLTPETAAVVVSIVEERTNLEAAIRIELDATHSYFTLTPVLHNPNTTPLAYQFWIAAIASPAGDNRAGSDLRFNLPVNSMQVHSTDDKTLPAEGQTMAWPVYNGRDLSVYGNWREFLSLFAATGANQPQAGLYAPRTDQGFVRVFPQPTTRGLKLFGPGNLPSYVWTTNNGDNSYVELWGGLTANFDENATLQPDESLVWTEYWYPFHGIFNYVWANKDIALSVADGFSEVVVRLYLTSAQTARVNLFVNSQPAAQWDAAATGPGVWQSNWARAAAGPIGVTIADVSNNLIARYGQTP